MAIKGYWRLNGNSNDASGNGNNGTNYGVDFSRYGRINTGAYFDGTDRIALPTNPFNFQSSSTSWFAWIKTSEYSSDLPVISTSYSLGENWITLGLYPGFGLYFTSVYNGVSYDFIYKDIFYADDKWHYIGVTLDSSVNSVSLWFDGSMVQTSSWVGVNTGSNTSHIGALRYNTSSYFYFTGHIDEVELNTEPLSAAKIKNNYSKYIGFF